ncbi:MAG: hypothetical protein Q7R35_03380 [Elusimicrobiota bacterium]|nr:hypothetical protein [Elusimicrobiota bacterium]
MNPLGRIGELKLGMTVAEAESAVTSMGGAFELKEDSPSTKLMIGRFNKDNLYGGLMLTFDNDKSMGKLWKIFAVHNIRRMTKIPGDIHDFIKEQIETHGVCSEKHFFDREEKAQLSLANIIDSGGSAFYIWETKITEPGVFQILQITFIPAPATYRDILKLSGSQPYPGSECLPAMTLSKEIIFKEYKEAGLVVAGFRKTQTYQP